MNGRYRRIARILDVPEELMGLAAEARAEVAMDVDRIEAICRENTARVLTAMAAADLRDYHFGGTEGYGYDDTGRDALERAFALAFGAEAALVRIQMVSGTHALACVLLGILRPGDLLVCAYGEPYDTLRTVIGISGAAAGSLLSMGVSYLQVPPAAHGEPDLDGIAEAAAGARMVLVQRSRGYSWRPPLSIEDIGRISQRVAQANPEAIVFVDNCYGEFTEVAEPHHGRGSRCRRVPDKEPRRRHSSVRRIRCGQERPGGAGGERASCPWTRVAPRSDAGAHPASGAGAVPGAQGHPERRWPARPSHPAFLRRLGHRCRRFQGGQKRHGAVRAPGLAGEGEGLLRGGAGLVACGRRHHQCPTTCQAIPTK